MKIYIVISLDAEYQGEGMNTRPLKAFADEQEAHEFMADCGFELEQWEKSLPAEVEDDEVNSANWHKHCEKHPFNSDGWYRATGFFCQEMELE
jgi:hypothetical protein